MRIYEILDQKFWANVKKFKKMPLDPKADWLPYAELPPGETEPPEAYEYGALMAGWGYSLEDTLKAHQAQPSPVKQDTKALEAGFNSVKHGSMIGKNPGLTS